jgi:hypothetical protein
MDTKLYKQAAKVQIKILKVIFFQKIIFEMVNIYINVPKKNYEFKNCWLLFCERYNCFF